MEELIMTVKFTEEDLIVRKDVRDSSIDRTGQVC